MRSRAAGCSAVVGPAGARLHRSLLAPAIAQCALPRPRHPCPCRRKPHPQQVRDAIYAAIRLPLVERHIRHEKHWKYVGNHTVQFWAKVSGAACAEAPPWWGVR